MPIWNQLLQDLRNRGFKKGYPKWKGLSSSICSLILIKQGGNPWILRPLPNMTHMAHFLGMSIRKTTKNDFSYHLPLKQKQLYSNLEMPSFSQFFLLLHLIENINSNYDACNFWNPLPLKNPSFEFKSRPSVGQY